MLIMYNKIMKTNCNNILNSKVYPIKIIYKGKSYLSLYYYTKENDGILHKENKSIVSFLTINDIERFCEENDLKLEGEIAEYDFDTPITNPVDYNRVLNNWNLLNTIAGTFGMFFEGDLQKYNAVYDLLFRLNTPVETIPPTFFVSKKYYDYILKVFSKQSRFLKRL